MFTLFKTKRLSQGEKKTLLRLARETISAKLNNEDLQIPAIIEKRLNQRTGVFVTLLKKGKLRGCIGYMQTDKPLYQSVQELAEAAAFHDPRFQPLKREELPDIQIEMSVLSGFEKISNIKRIKTRHHGILVRHGDYQGILLPQVAEKYNWGRETFLQHACVKANLPKEDWKNPETELFIFTAQIFEE